MVIMKFLNINALPTLNKTIVKVVGDILKHP